MLPNLPFQFCNSICQIRIGIARSCRKGHILIAFFFLPFFNAKNIFSLESYILQVSMLPYNISLNSLMIGDTNQSYYKAKLGTFAKCMLKITEFAL